MISTKQMAVRVNSAHRAILRAVEEGLPAFHYLCDPLTVSMGKLNGAKTAKATLYGWGAIAGDPLALTPEGLELVALLRSKWGRL